MAKDLLDILIDRDFEAMNTRAREADLPAILRMSDPDGDWRTPDATQ